MKKSLLTIVAAASLMFASCDYNEHNFPGLDNGNITDVKVMNYTMTADDYATVSSNSTNKSIANVNGQSAALATVKTQQAFSVDAPASIYAPAFLDAKWPTADDGSSIKLTYNMQQALPAYLQTLNAGNVYTVSNADYEAAWGKSGVKYFSANQTPEESLPSILSGEYPNAVKGDVVMVSYNMADEELTIGGLDEQFEYFSSTVYHAQVDGWFNIALTGTYYWQGRTYNSNGYLQNSAYNHPDGALDVYMISPAVDIVSGMVLSFDMAYRYYATEGGRIAVLISTDLVESSDDSIMTNNVRNATWTDVTSQFSFAIPAVGSSNNLASAGSYNLASYVGQRIHVAFRYYGDANGATTTAQIDNVQIKNPTSEATTSTPVNALYAFNGTTWAPYTEKTVHVLQKSEFNEMGINYDNFSASLSADHYLPIYLSNAYPYATEGTTVIVAYKYYANSVTSMAADEYVLTAGTWVKNTALEVVTDQFVKNNGVWVFDPSVVITLSPIRNDATIMAYYQAAVDWVWENVDVPAGCTSKGQGYVTSYGNNDYYSGCSAYYNNVDIRPAKAREQIASAYEGMTDDEVTALMEERLLEVMGHALEALHPDAVPVDGVEVTYTVKVAIYRGSTVSSCTHQMIYKVVGPGQFEYVPDSFQEI
ncbi:MAG: choice-of-anchor J domain-containing protein [Bacteroidales bacterium]|nr:choice-of-anchor J domain-containing protein [Bacteroidales bacterium]